MALDWDNIEIVTEEEQIIKISDSNIVNVDASDRMIIFSGQPGEDGPQGPAGPAGTVTVGTTTTLPAGSDATVVNRGTPQAAVLDFGIPKGVDGDNAPVWGNITGDLDDQADLAAALADKADTADLGTMAGVDDAPSDNKKYARKNGSWTEVTGGGGGSAEWGDITGTLSDQTDLQNALNAKANTADLGTLAGKNSVDYSTSEVTNKPTLGTLAGKNSVDYSTSEVTNKPTLGTMAAVNDATSDSKLYGRKNGAWSEVPTPSAPEWGDIGGTLADQTDLKNALDAKANTADLGALATQNKVDWDTDIDDIPSTFPPSSHTHGNITDGGAITSDTAVASGDKLVLADASDSSKLIRSEISFDGSTTTKGLTPKGTWESFAAASHTHDDRYYTETEIDNSLALKANNSIIADAFSTSAAYAVGDYVIYEGVLYRFTSAHSAGAWASGDVTSVVVGNELEGKAAASHTHDDRYYTETEIDGKFEKEIMYFTSQTVSVASSAQIMRIPASGTNSNITTDTVVLSCVFASSASITSNVTWTSYAGYVIFTGTCTSATTASVVLGTKGN